MKLDFTILILDFSKMKLDFVKSILENNNLNSRTI